jgi:XapX domain-containing protein
MTAALIGIVLGLAIGVACRLLDIPLPAPPKLVGALLVLAMTLGYVGAGALLPASATTAASSSAGTR